MIKEAKRNYFPGGNTPNGFVSFYDNILRKNNVGKLGIIKGGPGTGKSTFMKKVGDEIIGNGDIVHYLHCSSDNNSLDGIYLPKYNTALIDGTAPHIVDPRYPVALDTIFNFCEFIDEITIKKHSESIVSLCKDISEKFSGAYDNLKIANSIYQIMTKNSLKEFDLNEGNSFCYNTFKRVASKNDSGYMRKMFLSAICPQGLINYIDEISNDNYTIKIESEVGDCTYIIMKKLFDYCKNSNVDMEVYYCPLKPDYPEHIVFPNAQMAVSISNKYHSCDNADEVTYFKDFMKSEYDNSKEQNHYDEYIDNAVFKIGNAKKLHDDLEKLYISSVDFSKINEIVPRAVSFLTK